MLSMSIKNKTDIKYFEFLKVSEKITEDTTGDEVLKIAIEVFKPRNVNTFAMALQTNGKLLKRFKLDLNFTNAGRFIDADTYRKENDQLNMFKCILKPMLPWFKIENISLQEAEYHLKEWYIFLEDLKQKYEYIYNPPVRANTTKETQGSIERQAFAEHYGGYAEMTYLIANGLVKDFKSVWEWDLNYFLFWGEYLLRKRDVENIK